MAVTRRQVLRGGLASALLLAVRPNGVLARALPSIDGYGTPRASRLIPGSWVVHADLHNHSQYSDGAGDPQEFYASLRAAGLDVAALTDHSTLADGLPESPCAPLLALADAHAECMKVAGINETTWQATAALADAADRPGEFTAIRGFEWSSPTLGHMNVWFSREFTDPAHTGGLGTPDDLARFAAAEGFPLGEEAAELLATVIEQTPAGGLGMRAWYEWLKAAPDTPGLGGGADGIFGFNHPGREPGRFSEFVLDPDLVERCVSLELFNRRDDYLFELTDQGRPSPLVACLDAGWRPGILGVTDEHGTDWGFPDGKGRAGIWVDRLDRDAIRDAMLARRFYATNLKGLRLDATANGQRMGSTLGHRRGPITFALDIDRGEAWYGRPLLVQVLQTGQPLPTIVDVVEITVPRPDEPVITFEVPIDVEDGRWVVLRITDPTVDPDPRARGDYAAAGGAIAYTSPFFLDPDAPPAPAAVPPADTAAGPMPTEALPTTGGGSVLGGLVVAALGGVLALRSRRHGSH